MLLCRKDVQAVLSTCMKRSFFCMCSKYVFKEVQYILSRTLLLGLSKETLTLPRSPPDQVFWTKREVYYQPTIHLAEGLQISVRQMEA
jgi:hypothetical protein